MMRLLIIDDTACKKDLNELIRKNPKSVKLNVLQKGNWQFPAAYVKRIAINTADCLTLLNVSEILRCESNRNYTTIFMLNKKKIVVSKTLMDVESLLEGCGFIRIHKSHSVNMAYIEKYIKSEGGKIELTDGTHLPVAVRKKETLLKELNQL